MLHLLPYYVSEEDQGNYQDPSELLAEDQRNAWWKQYGKWKGLDHENMPKELELPKLQEITAQPLLNYLVAQTHEAGNITFTQDTNLNEIYQDLIVRVYKRSYAPTQTHKAIRAFNLSEKDFQRVFEEIAVATWHGNGRTTTVSEIHKHCEGLGLEHLLEDFQTGAEEGATRLLTAFYFRRADRITEAHEKTFEFTHKSFGEYLTARRIVRKLKSTFNNLEDWKKDSERGKNKKTLIREWITLFGPTAIDTYINSFIQDEVALPENKEHVLGWQKTLIELIEYVVDKGIPMEEASVGSFRESVRQAHNVKTSLIILHFACAKITQKVLNIDWKSEDGARIFLFQLIPERKSVHCPYYFNFLRFLNLSNQFLYFIDLYGANLQNSLLTKSISYGIFLAQARLEETDLQDTALIDCNMTRANLIEANLERANLTKARLDEARLYKVCLRRANLEGANLEGANLEGANLEGANLEGANLMHSKNLTYEQLITVSTLYQSKGIPKEILEKIQKTHPHLLEAPPK